MSTPNWLRYVLVAWCLLSLGCGPKSAIPGLTLAVPPTETTLPVITPGTGTGGTSSAFTITGVVSFEKPKFLNSSGAVAGRTIVVSPLRFVDVQAFDTNGNKIGSAVSTDETGRFKLLVPANTPVVATILWSTTASAGRFNADVRDLTDPGQVFAVTISSPGGGPIPGGPLGGVFTIAIDPFPFEAASDNGLGAATAASNILDAAFIASEAVRSANANAALPLVTFRYSPTSTQGSFFTFLGQSELPNIFIKSGNSDSDDTDEFDDSVIQHEFGHFVISQLSKDPSIGGDHGLADTLYPQLAYSEGIANWFSGIAGNVPAYLDTVGVTGPSALGFVFNLETRGTQGFAARGRTSEATVSELLWDLTDGVESRLSTDNDAAAIVFKAVLDGLKALRGSKVLLVIDDLLQQLIAQGSVSASTVNQLLTAPENQQLTLQLPDTFPVTISRPGSVVDSCFTVAANFGINSGLDVTNRFFKLDLLGATNNVSIGLFLLNNVAGTDATGTNINVFLLDAQTNFVAGPGPVTQATYENLQVNALPAGRYYLYVTGRPDPATAPTNATGISVDYRLEVQ